MVIKTMTNYQITISKEKQIIAMILILGYLAILCMLGIGDLQLHVHKEVALAGSCKGDLLGGVL